MLRDKDYELAVKLGIIDEYTKNKYQYTDDVCHSDDEASNYESEVAKLQDVIICLTKELLKKEENIQELQKNFNIVYSNKNEISEYLHQTKQELYVLEQIIDKLGEDK